MPRNFQEIKPILKSLLGLNSKIGVQFKFILFVSPFKTLSRCINLYKCGVQDVGEILKTTLNISTLESGEHKLGRI